MAASKSQRIKSLSTRYLGFYKGGIPVILSFGIFFLVWGVYQSYLESGRWFCYTYIIFYIAFLSWGWLRINRNVHRVEFDDEFLYVIQKGQDILIPLENIKEVDIKTLGGVYEVELFQP
jgi:membrane-bound acyltransferase YfiQ involved in biofilm formation